MNGNLRAIRQLRALSLDDLAQKSGIGRVTISRIENGKQKARPRTTRALAKALEIEVEKLTSEQAQFL